MPYFFTAREKPDKEVFVSIDAVASVKEETLSSSTVRLNNGQEVSAALPVKEVLQHFASDHEAGKPVIF